MKKTLRLILGDQLNAQHSWFQKVDENIIYVLFEMRQETDYVNHHIQKVVAFFASMENFAKQLREENHQVIYWELDAKKNKQSLVENLKVVIDENKIEHFEYQLPDEYRLDEQLKSFCKAIGITSQVFDSEHFMSTRLELRDFFEGKKTYLMESFYRSMRRKYDLMMDGDQPVTGKWNYDKENRKKIPKDHVPIEPLVFEKDVSEVHQRIIDAEPTDGLWEDGRVDSDQLNGMSYPDLEWCMQNSDLPAVDMSEQQLDNIELYKTIRNKNLHKMNPIPVFTKSKEV